MVVISFKNVIDKLKNHNYDFDNNGYSLKNGINFVNNHEVYSDYDVSVKSIQSINNFIFFLTTPSKPVGLSKTKENLKSQFFNLNSKGTTLLNSINDSIIYSNLSIVNFNNRLKNNFNNLSNAMIEGITANSTNEEKREYKKDARIIINNIMRNVLIDYNVGVKEITNNEMFNSIKKSYIKTLNDDSNTLIEKIKKPLKIINKSGNKTFNEVEVDGSIYILLDSIGDVFKCKNYKVNNESYGEIEIKVISKDNIGIKKYSLKIENKNSEGVFTGTLSEDLLSDASNNNTDGECFTYDDNLFFFWGSATGGSGGNASSLGDPYIFPLLSKTPVKLPNLQKCYRLYENIQENVYINCSVSQATLEHQRRMKDFAKKRTLNTDRIVCDGYFYDSFYFSSENNFIHINMQSKKFTISNNKYFKIDINNNNVLIKNSNISSYCKKMYISWNNSESNKLYKFSILFFSNPHVENGIEYITGPYNNAVGLLINNYKPKLFMIPKINTYKYKKIHRKLRNTKNIFYIKNIKNKTEKWHYSNNLII